MDPAKLAYVVVPHFEADECGGMGRFVKDAKHSSLLCSELGMALNLSGWDFNGPVKGVRDGTVIELGQKRLRFLETPHVHHWDSMMVFEETTRSLFPADLFIQPGEQPSIVKENLGKEMCQMYREVGIFAADKPVLDVVKRIEKLECNWIHPMHGGCLDGGTLKPYIKALREHPFAFDGKVFGRTFPRKTNPPPTRVRRRRTSNQHLIDEGELLLATQAAGVGTTLRARRASAALGEHAQAGHPCHELQNEIHVDL